jgi:hypothetical protein
LFSYTFISVDSKGVRFAGTAAASTFTRESFAQELIATGKLPGNKKGAKKAAAPPYSAALPAKNTTKIPYLQSTEKLALY